ncbi:MAG: DUF58 domain-containing protein [Chloroflexi bacterium]|nr:DUF58 domain-containing protein [Chloroflexota bacterium]
MSRIALLAALIYIIFLAGIGSLNGSVLRLALPLGLYLLAGLWRGPEKLNLSAERTLSTEQIRPGESITVIITVTNHGESLDQVSLHDPLPDFLEIFEGSNNRLVRLPAQDSLSWSYSVRGRRGSHTFNGLSILAEDSLGLVVKRTFLPTRGQLLVLPSVARVRHIAIQPRQTRVYSGIIPARQGGTGIEFFGLREYQIGDSPHHINWRLSARQDNLLYSNQYEQERVADVGIVVDGRSRINNFCDRSSIFDDSVLAAVAVSSALLSDGNRVGLLVYGDRARWTSPGYGKRQRERIMLNLALAKTGESQNFKSLFIPRRMFPTNSQIILISPLHSDDLPVLAQLRVSGYPLMVISPDPVSFEVRRLGNRDSVKLAARIARLEREIMLRDLRGLGIQVVNWNTVIPFDQAARASLSRPITFLRAIQREGRQ